MGKKAATEIFNTFLVWSHILNVNFRKVLGFLWKRVYQFPSYIMCQLVYNNLGK